MGREYGFGSVKPWVLGTFQWIGYHPIAPSLHKRFFGVFTRPQKYRRLTHFRAFLKPSSAPNSGWASRRRVKSFLHLHNFADVNSPKTSWWGLRRSYPLHVAAKEGNWQMIQQLGEKRQRKRQLFVTMVWPNANAETYLIKNSIEYLRKINICNFHQFSSVSQIVCRQFCAHDPLKRPKPRGFW